MGNQIKNLSDIKKIAHRFGISAEKWIDLKIKESPDGEDAEVLADDTQIMFLLLTLSDIDQITAGNPV